MGGAFGFGTHAHPVGNWRRGASLLCVEKIQKIRKTIGKFKAKRPLLRHHHLQPQFSHGSHFHPTSEGNHVVVVVVVVAVVATVAAAVAAAVVVIFVVVVSLILVYEITLQGPCFETAQTIEMLFFSSFIQEYEVQSLEM